MGTAYHVVSAAFWLGVLFTVAGTVALAMDAPDGIRVENASITTHAAELVCADRFRADVEGTV